MHLYFLTRGEMHFTDIWASSMRSQIFKWPRKNLTTGKMEEHYVQGALKPIQLWEYVMPEGLVPEVLESLKIPSGGKNQGHDNYMKWIAKGFRAGLKLEPIPKFPAQKTIRLIPRQGLSIYCLGTKKDDVNTTFGYEQEGI